MRHHRRSPQTPCSISRGAGRMVSEQAPAAEVEKTEAAAPAESEEPKAEQQAADEAPVVEDVKEDEDDDDEDDDDDDDEGTMSFFLSCRDRLASVR